MSDLPPPPGPRWQPPGSPPVPPPVPPMSDGLPFPASSAPRSPVSPPSASGLGAPSPITLSPSEPPSAPERSRLPAVIGAIVAIALGAGVVVWLTGSGDDEPTGRDDASATTEAEPNEPAETAAPTTPTTPDTPATTPATAAPLTLPSTIVPETTAAPAPPVTPPPVVEVPPGAVAYADPAGWSLSVDPAWQRSPDGTAWFTGTGSADFQDNVNVAVEALAAPQSLDAYVTAAIALIGAQASDLEITEQRRSVGADGVEVEVIIWSGSFAGLPRLSFVQVVNVAPTRAYIATFTSQPDRMAGLAPAITPYLVTLRGA